MRGAVIGEKMPVFGDARENVGMSVRHLADDEERRLDASVL